MRKLGIILLIVVVCSLPFCTFGCGGNELDGKYYLVSGNAQNGGQLYNLLAKNDDGTYVNVVGGSIDPKEFWVELKDGEMTVHGSITPIVGASIAYKVDSEVVKTFKYELKTCTDNESWYSIYSGDEDTLYIVKKSGKTLGFEYGDPSDAGSFWYSIFYEMEE